MTADAAEAAEVFRSLHRPGEPLLLPNAWDYASAAALVEAGFAAIGTTSLGVAAAHGLTDGQGTARAETVALTHRLSRLPTLLTVDIEGGFSDDPDEVAQLAYEVAAAGAVGVNLEDGRPDGSLGPLDRQQELIRAIRSRVPGLFVNARTDTHWLAGPDGPSVSETITRIQAYVEAGAHGEFVPGLADDGSIRTVVSNVDAPLNVLFLPARHDVRRLADLGVARISYGSLLFRAALHTTVTTALAVAKGEPVPGDIPSYAETNSLTIRY
jgi:2-methylisocitrate lyase-like PEP mutase family enzyme